MNLDPNTLPVATASTAIDPHVGAGSDLFQTTATTMVVARSFSGSPVLMGLGEPLELRGGHALAPDRLTSEIILDWAPEAQEAVARACLERSLAREPWFRMSPTALTGPVGAGRTHVARSIARGAGVPFVGIDMSGPLGADRLRRVRRSPDVALPNAVLMAMACTGCANPIVLVTGADGASGRAQDLLAALIASDAAFPWTEETLEASVDLSQVTWMVQTIDAEALPRPISSLLTSVEIPELETQAGRELLAMSVLTEVLGDYELDAVDLSGDVEALADWVGTAPGPAAQLHKHAEQLLLRLLKRQR